MLCVQVNVVVGAGGQVGGAGHGEGDLPTDEGVVGSSLHWSTVSHDVRLLFFRRFHFIDSRLILIQIMLFHNKLLLYTKYFILPQ